MIDFLQRLVDDADERWGRRAAWIAALTFIAAPITLLAVALARL